MSGQKQIELCAPDMNVYFFINAIELWYDKKGEMMTDVWAVSNKIGLYKFSNPFYQYFDAFRRENAIDDIYRYVLVTT